MAATDAGLSAVLRADRDLDEMLLEQVQAVLAESEAGALNLADRSVSLHRSAAHLTETLGHAGRGAELEELVARGATAVSTVVGLVEQLPDWVRADQRSARAAAEKHIDRLAAVLETMEQISLQVKVLALNASVLAASAGEDGRPFGVVAGEMRALAERSADSVTGLRRGLGEARRALSDGKPAGLGARIDEVNAALESVRALHREQQSLASFYREILAEVVRQHETVVEEIGGILTSVQSQDVVRQRLERLTETLKARGELLRRLPEHLRAGQALERLASQLADLTADHLRLEARHAEAGVAAEPATSRIELF